MSSASPPPPYTGPPDPYARSGSSTPGDQPTARHAQFQPNQYQPDQYQPDQYAPDRQYPLPGQQGPGQNGPGQNGPGQQPEQHRDIHNTSVGTLLGDVTRDFSTLMRQELALAQAEIKQEVSKAAKGAGALTGAGLAGYFVLLFLSIALWAGLTNLMDAGWAGLIVAVLWGVIAAVLFVFGRGQLRSVQPKPERTVDTLGQVPEALRPGHHPNANPGVHR